MILEFQSVEERWNNIMVHLLDIRNATPEQLKLFEGERFVMTEFIPGMVEYETYNIPNRITRDMTGLFVQKINGRVFDAVRGKTGCYEKLSAIDLANEFDEKELVPFINFWFVAPKEIESYFPFSRGESKVGAGVRYGICLRRVDHKKLPIRFLEMDSICADYDGIFVPNLDHKCFKK